MASASKLGTVSTRRQRIAKLAKQSPQMGFTSLAYFIDLDWLHEAYQRTRKDGATGVNGQTAADYAAYLEKNLQSLLDRQVRDVPSAAGPTGAHSERDGKRNPSSGNPDL